jgi:transcriptional regulator with XRE-family HTH domain
MVDKNELITAVRTVREALGMSQQAFATRLGVSIRSISHYEADRPPRGRTLVELQQLAKEAGREKEEQLFRLASREELGAIVVTGFANQLVPHTDVERVLVGSVLFLHRSKAHELEKAKLAQLLIPASEEYLKELARKSMKSVESLLGAEASAGDISAKAEEHTVVMRLIKAWNEYLGEVFPAKKR